jgi:hypothetical protein
MFAFRIRRGQARGRRTRLRARLLVRALEARVEPTTFVVTNTLDGPVTAAGQLPGSLRQAIFDANANPGADSIVFDPSLVSTGDTTISLSTFDAGLDSLGVGPTALLITSPITIIGPSGDFGVTIARSATAANFRLFHVRTGGDLTIEYLTLSGGMAVGFTGGVVAGASAGMGGAIFNQGTVTIRNSTLVNNQARGGTIAGVYSFFPGYPFVGDGGGGGLGSVGAAGTGATGGGPNGGAGAQGYPNTQVSPAMPGGFGGGGGAGWDGATANNNGSVFPGAAGGFGGGGGAGGAPAVIPGSGAGTAGGAGGFGGGGGCGGIGYGGGPNGAMGPGGFGGGAATLIQYDYPPYEIFMGGGGGAGMGGAIFNADGSVTVVNSTLTNDTAFGGYGYFGVYGSGLGLGGAILSHNGMLTVTSSTLTANSADDGGGAVYVAADGGTPTVTLYNSILANTSRGASDFAFNGAAIFAGSGNLIRNNSGFTGGVVSTADPSLTVFAHLGGPTQGYGLLSGSPAIDAGDNAQVGSLTTDQRGPGYPRVDADGKVDIGAVEGAFDNPYVSAVSLPPQVTNAGPTPNTVVVTFAAGVPIDHTSIKAGNIQILDPSNNPLTITGASSDYAGGPDVTPLTATYTFTAPGGTWTNAANGKYTVNLLGNQIANTDTPTARYAFPQSVGTFQVAVALPTGKLNPLGPIIAAGPTPNSLTVTYSSTSSNINVSSINPSNITITGPGGTLAVTGSSVNVNSNGTPRTATYTFAVPGGSWTNAADGTYTVAVQPSQVSDMAGQYVAAGTLGKFVVDLPRVLHVTLTGDGNPTSGGTKDSSDPNGLSGDLRYCIGVSTAEPAVVADTITFDPTVFVAQKTISLGATLPISNSAVVNGPGASLVTIDGGSVRQLFTIDTANAGGRTVTITGLTLAHGKSTYGGAIMMGTSADSLTLSNCIISGNTATSGGGAIYDRGGSMAVLTITDSLVSNNSSGGSGGGAIFANNSAGTTLNVMRSTVTGNTTTDHGGFAYWFWGGSINVSSSTLTNNIATNSTGGVIASWSAPIMISNSTFQGNKGSGGGAVQIISSASLTINNSTLVANSATGGSGGAIASASGMVTLNSSIIAKNIATTGGPDLNAAITTGGDYNLIGVANSGGFTLGGTHNKTGTAVSPLNPMVAPLARNGGPTQTMALLPGSSAIDMGSNPGNLSNDQRGPGFVRVFGSAADIGAFEVQPGAQVLSLKVNDGSAQRSRVTSLTLTFSSSVLLPANAAAAFLLKRQSDNASVSLIGSVTGNSVVLAFGSGAAVDNTSLADGRYTLTALASQINGGNFDGNGDGILGDDYVLVGTPANGLFRLFGDVNGDGSVSASDLIAFREYFGGYLFTFDFDGDGSVSASDFVQFRLRFGGSI